MNSQHPLQRAYYLRQPHVLISLATTTTDGSLEADTLDEARQLRRGLVTALFEVSKAIRAQKRRERAERAASRRDEQRATAYAKEAAA